jgi:hypothetical protein
MHCDKCPEKTFLRIDGLCPRCHVEKEYPEWLRDAAAKGGKKSRRKLTKKEARRIALIGWEKRREAAKQFRESHGR